MDTGVNKGLFTLIAVVIFGIFLSMSYWLFQDELVNVLANVMDKTSQSVNTKLSQQGLAEMTYESYTYTETNGTLTITDYDVAGGKSVIIPSEISGKPVTTIGGDAFAGKGLTSVTIPNSVTTIMDSYTANNRFYYGAFAYNNLTTVNIPDSVTYIGNCAFFQTNLKNLTLGNSVKTIATDVFTYNDINTVILPSSLRTIGNYAFHGSKISNVVFNEGLTSIAAYAFWSNNLTSITLPSTLTGLGTSFLRDNNLLTTINLPTSLKSKIVSNNSLVLKATAPSNLYFTTELHYY